MLAKGSTALPYEPYYSGIKSATATKITSGTGFKKLAVGDTIDNLCMTQDQIDGIKELNHNLIFATFRDSTNGYDYNIYTYSTFEQITISKKTVATGAVTYFQSAVAFSYTFMSPVVVLTNTQPDYSQTNTGTSQAYPTNFTFPTSTLTIPTAITSLDGYGIGLSTTDNAYRNYIDFENKQFVQNQKKIRLTSALSWAKQVGTTIDYFEAPLLNMKNALLVNDYEIIANGFETGIVASTGTEDGLFVCGVTGTLLRFRNGDVANTTLDEWKAYLDANEIYLVYTLATPIVTDISGYITSTTYKVWANGTETFDCDVAPTLDSIYFVSRIKEEI